MPLWAGSRLCFLLCAFDVLFGVVVVCNFPLNVSSEMYHGCCVSAREGARVSVQGRFVNRDMMQVLVEKCRPAAISFVVCISGPEGAQ